MNESVINKSGNKHCALCGGKNPSWGCLPFAVLVCTKCAGGMRELGTGVCVVRSLLLDSVSEEFLAPFLMGSNSLFLDWYGNNCREELSLSFFKTDLAKEYAEQLKSGAIKEKTAKSAPVIGPGDAVKSKLSTQKKSKPKSKLKLIVENDDEASEEDLDAPETEQPQNAAEKEIVAKKKTVIKRVPGKILTDESNNASRLGMFKNVEDLGKTENDGTEGKKFPGHSSMLKPSRESSSRVLTGGDTGSFQSAIPAEVIKGKNFIGSAPPPKESVADKLKKSLEKGKRTLFNTFKK
ncbi:hypothetical protein NEMIN01_1689 [Nematocida minor]|uniref:uncharacterized protein n=1 Tax=Nematocida minor TaxID=1912983 RepID=UPI00221FEC79|nr:uncharacterized protein NEMIN01_1689 [Nematocida minor]KAI5191834.1 hypothetical protein NEMIN01_1689 [Nematocida minor]